MSEKRTADTAAESPAATKAGKLTYLSNINNALDKKHEVTSYQEVLKLPPSALQGLADHADATFADLHVRTIGELGSWKYFRFARAVVELSKLEEAGKRAEGNRQNLNKALDQAWETRSLVDIAGAPIEALQGVGPKAGESLAKLGLKTISDLADYKFCRWAEAIVAAAEFENADFSSR